MLDKVTAKIQKTRLGYQRYSHLYHCSCSYKHETNFEGEFECPTCGNSRIVPLDREYKTKQVRSNIEVLDKGLKHFEMKRNKYRLVFKKDDTIEVKLIMDERLRFNLVEDILELERDGELVENLDHKKIDKFFEENESMFVESASIPESREFYRMAYSMMTVQRGHSYYTRKKSVGNTLMQMLNHKYLETLFFGGFTEYELLKGIYDGRFSNIDKSGKSPKDIFKCDKPMTALLKRIGKFESYEMGYVKNMSKNIGFNNLKTVFEVWMEEHAETNYIGNFCNLFLELAEKHGYKNYKRLADYVCREVKLQQGIDSPTSAMQLLRDYIKTNKELNHKWDKYPKSLKKHHDISMMNHKIIQDRVLKDKMDSVVTKKEYKQLMFKDKEYCITIPEKAEDIIREGQSMSHCVASYVKDVANEICKVLFMRRTESEKDSLITIEVRGNKIRQVKGFDNRMPSKVEEDFVKKWATKKKLEIVGF